MAIGSLTNAQGLDTQGLSSINQDLDALSRIFDETGKANDITELGVFDRQISSHLIICRSPGMLIPSTCSRALNRRYHKQISVPKHLFAPFAACQ